jgi:hypothetical protein
MTIERKLKRQPLDTHHRHTVASPTGRRQRRCAGDCRGGNRRCTRCSRRPISRHTGRPNGNGIAGVRGIRRQPPSSRNLATTQCRTYCFDKRVHGKTRTGNPQPRDGGLEPKRNRDLAISTATRTCQKSAIAAEAAGRADLVPMWAGQSANLSTCTDVSAFLTSLVEEVSEIAGPIIQWSAARRNKQILKSRRKRE